MKYSRRGVRRPGAGSRRLWQHGSGIPAPPAAQGGARFLVSAATKSRQRHMKTDLTVTMLSSQLPGGRMEMTATGALDNANHRMSMRIDMSKLASQLGAAGAAGSANDGSARWSATSRPAGASST